jgi:hypothetical protein
MPHPPEGYFTKGLDADPDLAAAPGAARAADGVEIEAFDSNGKSRGVSRVEKIVRTDAE